MDYKKLFCYAMETGEVMLRNGAETSRVEDTINRILKTAGLQVVESFVTPTGIFATLDDERIEMITYVKRVYKREVHLYKVALANDLSRRFCAQEMPLEEAIRQLDRIKEELPYPNWLMVLAKGIGAGCYAYVFGGDMADAFAAMGIGFFLSLLQILLRKGDSNKFFEDILGGAFIGILAIFFYHFLKIGSNFDLIIVGAIMPLVPGVAITNAIREVIQGDFVSGISRTADAFIVAAAVAVGVGSVLKIFYAYFGGVAL